MSERRFRNLCGEPNVGGNPARDESRIRGFMRWMAMRRRGPWRRWVDAVPGPKPPARVSGARFRVTAVGHATVLVQLGGVNLVTDPMWSMRASPIPWAGPRRHRPPGIRFEDLPKIDVVLVSHNHFDHMDLPTLKRFAEVHAPQFVTALGNAKTLAEAGVRRVSEIDWWETVRVADGVRVTAVPAQHFSRRGLGDADAALWCGFVVSDPAGSVYFAGDTGWGAHFAMIRERLGAPRVALLPIGAFRPEWFMAAVHMSPSDAVRAHVALGAAHSIAIHHGVFRLAEDGELEPGERLAGALAEAEIPRDRFLVTGFGEGREF